MRYYEEQPETLDEDYEFFKEVITRIEERYTKPEIEINKVDKSNAVKAMREYMQYTKEKSPEQLNLERAEVLYKDAIFKLV